MTEKQANYKTKKRFQTIFHIIHNPDNPYVIMDKRPLENKKISYGSKGVLAYLLSRPNDWKLQLGDLVAHSPDGPYAIRKMIKELRCVGHVKLIKIIDELGRAVEWIYEVHEFAIPSPDVEIRHLDEQPDRDSPLVDYPLVGNRDVNNIDSNNKDSNNINDNEAISDRIALFSALYSENIGAISGGLMADMIRNDVIDYPDATWYPEAFKIAVKNNARNLKYVEAVLQGWKLHGLGWKPGNNGHKPAGKTNQKTNEEIKKELVDAG